MFKIPPAISKSAITNWPGRANAKNVEEKLCQIVKELLKLQVNILNPNPMAGVPNIIFYTLFYRSSCLINLY